LERNIIAQTKIFFSFFTLYIITSVTVWVFEERRRVQLDKRLVADEGVIDARVSIITNLSVTSDKIKLLESYPTNFVLNESLSVIHLVALRMFVHEWPFTARVISIGICAASAAFFYSKIFSNFKKGSKLKYFLLFILIILPSYMMNRSYAITDGITSGALLLCIYYTFYNIKDYKILYVFLSGLILSVLQLYYVFIIVLSILIVIVSYKRFSPNYLNKMLALIVVIIINIGSNFIYSNLTSVNNVLSNNNNVLSNNNNVLSNNNNVLSNNNNVLSNNNNVDIVDGSLLREYALDTVIPKNIIGENRSFYSEEENIIKGFIKNKISLNMQIRDNSVSGVLVNLENLYWILVIIGILLTIFLRQKLIGHSEISQNKEFVYPTFIILLLGVISINLYDDNFGTYFRHRGQLNFISIIATWILIENYFNSKVHDRFKATFEYIKFANLSTKGKSTKTNKIERK
jgi:hypothetical protein